MTDKKTSLAVDDNVTELAMFNTALRDHYDFKGAKSAVEALEIMNTPAAGTIDMILLDIEMPNISGFEFLHDIRKNPRHMKTPVIIVSCHSEPDFLEHAKNSSASEVLTKPVDPAVLLETIARVFSSPPKTPFDL